MWETVEFPVLGSPSRWHATYLTLHTSLMHELKPQAQLDSTRRSTAKVHSLAKCAPLLQRFARRNKNSPLDLAIPGFAYSYSMALFWEHRAHSADASSTAAPDQGSVDNELLRAVLLYPIVIARLVPKYVRLSTCACSGPCCIV